MTDTPQDELVVVLAEELVKGTRLELSYDEAEEVARAAIASMPIAALRAENEALRLGLERAGRALENVGMAPYAQARKEIAALLGRNP